eukprot:7390494-Prymnesium_polylepis.2
MYVEDDGEDEDEDEEDDEGGRFGGTVEFDEGGLDPTVCHDATPDVDDEVLFSHSRYWSPQLKQLLSGSMELGDPRSMTGLLVGVAPMLLHSTAADHPERPARMVAIYHELVEQGLAAKARHVPVRLAAIEDLCLVHERAQVELSVGAYESDAAASQALGLDGDTYFSAAASGRAAKLSAGSVVEVKRTR